MMEDMKETKENEIDSDKDNSLSYQTFERSGDEKFPSIINPCFSETESVEDNFFPYTRQDKTLIHPLYDTIQTIFCAIFLLPLRCFILLFCIAMAYLISSLALAGLPLNYSPLQPLAMWRAMLVMMLRPLMRLVLFACGFVWVFQEKCSWEDLGIQRDQYQHTSKHDRAYVIIANHLGYLDILLLMCKFGGAFVAKEAIKTTPVIGVCARALQTLFLQQNLSLTELLLQRVNDTYACHQKQNAGEILKQEQNNNIQPCLSACGTCLTNLVIFPEGTTTNGEAMVKFRSGIFLAGKPIQPVAIKLHSHTGFSLSWETIYFKTHLFKTMTQLYNYAQLIELPIYKPSDVEKLNPHLFSQNVQLLFNQVLKQPTYLLNRKQKFLYHKYVLNKINQEELMKEAKEEFNKDSTLKAATVNTP